jgi:flagellar biosynthesis/type III secretory pathway protein FliH
MLFTEWNWDDALAVRFEEGMEEGLEKGLEEGQNMVLELMREGYSAEQIEAKLTAVKSGVSPSA